MVVIWLIGALYSTLVVALSANNAFNVFNDRTDLIQWTVSAEDFVLAVSNLIILILAFVIGK
jgi:polyferredoxin